MADGSGSTSPTLGPAAEEAEEEADTVEEEEGEEETGNNSLSQVERAIAA